MPDWRRVTRRHPCPICAGTGWCSVSINGEVCLCMRVESDWPALKGMGGHVHRLVAQPTAPPLPRSVHTGPVITAAEHGTIALWILDQLQLRQEHREHLNGPERCLNDEQIERRGYRSWPGLDARHVIAEEAWAEFGMMMRGVPGFYIDEDLDAYFVGPKGLLLPVRNVDNDIAGFQVRPDTRSSGKRLWLSSIGRTYGSGSGARPHVSRPRFVTSPTTLYIVEGVFSADICSDNLGAVCLGLPGVTNWRGIDWKKLINQLGAAKVIIALDQDRDELRARKERTLLVEALRDYAVIEMATWDASAAKGFDDCLNAGLGFRLN